MCQTAETFRRAASKFWNERATHVGARVSLADHLNELAREAERSYWAALSPSVGAEEAERIVAEARQGSLRLARSILGETAEEEAA